MSDGKIWTKETTELLVDIAYDAFGKKVPFFLRGLVKPALRMAIKLINEKADKVVPDKIDTFVNDAIVKASNKDFEGAATDIALAGDLLVDIPVLDNEQEKKLFITIATAIVQAVENWIASKR